MNPHYRTMGCVRFSCIVALALLSSVITTITAAPNGSLITSVPGFTGSLPSQHYGGYVTIDGKPSGNKNLFYYFVASERDPSNDPVVLWLNGGPGCSSFDGFVYEHGPFNFQPGSLKLNPYSWSKVASIIYLDSPCGVGLSYSDNPKNYNTGDNQTASDSHAFLLKWFQLYPEFLKNPFYISGESYAGIYVPTLALKVVQGIEAGEQPSINFKGYLVGNGLTDEILDGKGYLPFVYGMGLISNDIYEDIKATCRDKDSAECDKNIRKVFQAVAGTNVYNILEPCYRHPTVARANQSSGSSSIYGHSNVKRLTRKSDGRSLVRLSGRDGRVPLDPNIEPEYHVPCINDDLATEWLNDEAVRKAIHAAPISVAGRWTICADRVDYNTELDSVISHHKNLTARGYSALIYSGDHDRAVPYTGTELWTRSLGYKITEEWRSWWSNDQVAGYLQAYDKNLTFLTIKGAGHMVPQYKPRESLDFFTRWLDGKPI